ncbi:MAG: class I SAM-dependent methyltransferase [Candidatus Krumholzibacteriia bacterium]
METVTIAAPSAELRVTATNGRLLVFVDGETVSRGSRRRLAEPVSVRASVATLRKLVEVKGDWWLEELERRTDPVYVRRRLETLIARFGTLAGLRILDVGAGGGSSSFMLMDLGAAQVLGVEPDPQLVELAGLRARDEGLDGQISFLQVEDTSRLPVAAGQFDAVTFNAVLEHIPPAARGGILREVWRCLRPGGLLICCETPNRAFPYDGHTTHLPLIPWLPLPLACPLARTFSRHVPRGLTRDEYIARGLVGGSYWQVTRALPDAVCLNAGGGDAVWKTSFVARRSSRGARPVLVAVEAVLNRCGLPLNAFMPTLDLVFRKPGRAA